MLTAKKWKEAKPPNLDLKNDPLVALLNFEQIYVETASLKKEAELANSVTVCSVVVHHVEKALTELQGIKKSASGKEKVAIERCIKKLQKAILQVKKLRATAKDRNDRYEAAKAFFRKTVKAWRAALRKFDGEVVSIIEGLRKCETQCGAAESLIYECVMQFVARAEVVKMNGNDVQGLNGFLGTGDKELLEIYRLWKTQVNMWVKAQSQAERLQKCARNLCPYIDTLNAEVLDAHCHIRDLIVPRCNEEIAFFKLYDEVIEFHRNTRTDKYSKSFQSFRFFMTTCAARDFEKIERKRFDKALEKMKGIDAQSYLLEEAAKHGFLDKMLAKARAQVKGLYGQMMKLICELEKEDLAPKVRSALIAKLKAIRDELTTINERYKRGRRNQQLANQLAADANRAYKAVVDTAMNEFSDAATDAANLFKKYSGA